MFYTIYKTTNLVNGKIYIGSHKTKDLDDQYMGSGKYLLRAIEKHGVENFKKEILFVFDDPEDMYAKEAELVNEDFLAEENTYNLKVGGYGGFDYLNSDTFVNPCHSTEHAKRMCSSMQTKLVDPIFRSSWRNKIRMTVKTQYLILERTSQFKSSPEYGKTGRDVALSESSKLKRRKTFNENQHQKGEKNSQYGSRWITDGITNKKISNTQEIPISWRLGRVLKIPVL